MTALGECWEWKGTRHSRGYGIKCIGNVQILTHRLAWAWANSSWDENGPRLPAGLSVLHRCDNPPCCNPDHLFLGTHTDNMADMTAKGRHPQKSKTHCPQGHPYSGDNLRVVGLANGRRQRRCHECHLASDRRRKAKKKRCIAYQVMQ